LQVRLTRNRRPNDSKDVLTLGKLGHGQEAYYLDSVASGIEDYYSGEGEAPGRWIGSGCEELGLFGEVESKQLRHILNAEHPDSGEPLVSLRGGRRIPGFDLTFSAPKSVSLHWALSDPATRRVVRECHERAVAAALDYIEREAAFVRRGAGGTEVSHANGVIAAAFPHRSSRAGDPQLHTHVLVANLAQGPDGRYSALHGSHLYRQAKTGGYLYQAQLRAELSRELGLAFQPIRRGAAELEGFADHVLREFSRRRAEIERALAERGLDSPQAAQVAALDSRRAKEYGVAPEDLHARWQQRGRELGAELPAPGIAREASQRPAEPHPEQLARAVTAERSHFDRREAIQAVCEQSPAGIEATRAVQIADAFLASEQVVRIAEGPFGPRFSTPEILAIEQRVINGAETLRDAGRGVAPSEVATAVIERRPTIGADQAEMVRRLLNDGDGIALVIGRPGAGKTYALNGAAEGWAAAGHRVRGAAPTRAAAAELEAAAGIPTVSVAALLGELDDRAANPDGISALPCGGVLLVDEAAMVGSRSLARLHDHVEAAAGKLVLIGDHRQLTELEAGGLFRALAERTNPIELIEVRRHRHALDRDNVERVRQGRGAEAFEAYRDSERVVIATDSESRREAMVADWWRAVGEGQEAIMIAKRNTDVAELDAQARELLRASGALGKREVEVAGEPFAVGDIVLTRVNSTPHGVANRMRWRIAEIDAENRIALERLSDGRRALLDHDYLERVNPQSGAPALQHGYAGTIYVAQGQSVERAFVAAEAAMSLEEFNTALSRSVEQTNIYAVAAPEPAREEFAPREVERPDPLDELVGSMERPAAQLAAVDEARAAPLRQLPTSELVGRADEPLVEAELAERRRLAIAAARVSPPPYVREAIGPRPEQPPERARWERGLSAIERYRQAHGITDSQRALGAEPGSGFEQAAYERARNRLAEVQRELGRSELTHELSHSIELAL
jgi:conjugative relaxase-like TrwC/TraI family protein